MFSPCYVCTPPQPRYIYTHISGHIIINFISIQDVYTYRTISEVLMMSGELIHLLTSIYGDKDGCMHCSIHLMTLCIDTTPLYPRDYASDLLISGNVTFDSITIIITEWALKLQAWHQESKSLKTSNQHWSTAGKLLPE